MYSMHIRILRVTTKRIEILGATEEGKEIKKA